MRGKRSLLYYLAAKSLGIEAYDLINAFIIIENRLSAIDIRYLCRFGIPASRMRQKGDLEKWVFETGIEYTRRVKNSKMYKGKRYLDRMLLLIRKRILR